MLNIKNQILKFMNAIFSVIQILISKKKYFINKMSFPHKNSK